MLAMATAIALLAASAEPAVTTAAVEVAQSQVCIPEGYFLLVRRNGSVGAIRLEHVKALKEPGTGEADYQSYFSQDGTALTSPMAVRRHGKVKDAALAGLGRLAVQPKDTRLQVGPFSFDYGFPGCVGMNQAGKAELDEGFEFAPTDVVDLAKLDPDGPWRWFRVEKNRRIRLSLGELRGAPRTAPQP